MHGLAPAEDTRPSHRESECLHSLILPKHVDDFVRPPCESLKGWVALQPGRSLDLGVRCLPSWSTAGPGFAANNLPSWLMNKIFCFWSLFYSLSSSSEVCTMCCLLDHRNFHGTILFYRASHLTFLLLSVILSWSTPFCSGSWRSSTRSPPTTTTPSSRTAPSYPRWGSYGDDPREVGRRWQVIIIGTERKFPQVMTSIVFNSVPIETTEDNWGTNPVLDRIKTVIRELKRWENIMHT